MKKLLFSLFFLLFISSVFLPVKSLFAITLADDLYPPNPNLLGQNHYYSVFLRGNGESVVSFKSNYTNSSDRTLSTISYYLPENKSLNNISIYQVSNSYTPCDPIIYGAPQAKELDEDNESEILRAPGSTSTAEPNIAPDQNSINPRDLRIIPPNPCLEQPQYYMGYNNTYRKADYEMNGNQLIVNLPQPVQPNASLNIFLTYRSFDFVTKNIFGALDYKFMTLKTDQSVDNLQVGISTEQDFVLEGVEGRVNYLGSVSRVLPPEEDLSGGIYNQQFDNFYNQIGQGTVYKYASQLAPMESYEVKGAYAQSMWHLYAQNILAGLLIVVILTLIIIMLIKKLIHKMPSHESKAGVFAWKTLPERQKSLVLSVSFSLISATSTVILHKHLHH